MDLQKVKESLEKTGEIVPAGTLDSLPSKFYDLFILKGLNIDKIERGRVICSMTVPRRLLNSGNFLHGGVTMSLVDLVGTAAFFTVGSVAGVSLEISVSYLDSAFTGEEIEIEANVLRAGKAVGVVTVELRKKKTGKLIAQGRHTKYLVLPSRL